MNQICCMPEPETPTVALNVNCACCESTLDERNVKDMPDLNMNETEDIESSKFDMCTMEIEDLIEAMNKLEIGDEELIEEICELENEDEESVSCCFKLCLKPHAKHKIDKKYKVPKDGSEA